MGSRVAVVAGSLLAGRYRLVEQLPGAGMGRVWRASDDLLDRPVAAKEITLPPGLGEHEEQEVRRRMMHGARTAVRLRHPGVVPVHDVVEQDGRPWIVMEFVPSQSLDRVLRTHGALSPEDAARVGLRILEAVEAADAAGLRHGDVTPANVLLGNDGRVVLTDFGITSFLGDEVLTAAGIVVGSPDFIAPERARGTDGGGIEADLWSLGATLYAAVEGAPPFQRAGVLPTLAAVMTDEPPPPRHAGPLGPLIDGLLVKEPAHRLGADAVRGMLERVVRGAPVRLRIRHRTPTPVGRSRGSTPGGHVRTFPPASAPPPVHPAESTNPAEMADIEPTHAVGAAGTHEPTTQTGTAEHTGTVAPAQPAAEAPSAEPATPLEPRPAEPSGSPLPSGTTEEAGTAGTTGTPRTTGPTGTAGEPEAAEPPAGAAAGGAGEAGAANPTEPVGGVPATGSSGAAESAESTGGAGASGGADPDGVGEVDEAGGQAGEVGGGEDDGAGGEAGTVGGAEGEEAPAWIDDLEIHDAAIAAALAAFEAALPTPDELSRHAAAPAESSTEGDPAHPDVAQDARSMEERTARAVIAAGVEPPSLEELDAATAKVDGSTEPDAPTETAESGPADAVPAAAAPADPTTDAAEPAKETTAEPAAAEPADPTTDAAGPADETTTDVVAGPAGPTTTPDAAGPAEETAEPAAAEPAAEAPSPGQADETAPPKPTPAGAAVPGPTGLAAVPTARTRIRPGSLVAIVTIVLAGLAAVLLPIVLGNDGTRSTTVPPASNPAPAPPADRGAALTGAVPQPGLTGSPEPAAPPPAGFRLHRDPTGFAIAVPSGWRAVRDGTLVDFRDPDSSRFLRIDQRSNPRSDPYDDWVAQQPEVAKQLAGYDLKRIERVRYRGWPTADWEFTWGSRTAPLHVLNRNVVPNQFRAYALYWSTSDSRWAADRELFDVIASTFSPVARAGG